MATSRRKFTPEEKARIVLEILKEEKSVAQLSSEHGIHANVLNGWKSETVQNLSQLFVIYHYRKKPKLTSLGFFLHLKLITYIDYVILNVTQKWIYKPIYS
ncbi:transposase [Paenibacillus phoenicis]